MSSIIINYIFGRLIANYHFSKLSSRRNILITALTLNLMCLAYFKYYNFFLSNIRSMIEIEIPNIILPLGISFFTFTQIAFLIDAYHGKVKSFNFIHYCLFVTYFPHLIAGPILHHKKMIDQFADPKTQVLKIDNITLGFTYFVIGLAKKILIADTFAKYSDPIFSTAGLGPSPTFFEAWLGAIAFSFQIYFDFSAYSDMAIGISKILGISLPVNFNSPYKSRNISEFWRRWHISLSSFLRDYLYIPLGGNRKGELRKYLNLITVMVLGGLWHGANWTFVVWGGLHGLYLTVYHLWSGKKNNSRNFGKSEKILEILSILVTFTLVTIAWVFFRSPNFTTALEMLKGMFLINGISFPSKLSLLGQIPMITSLDLKFNGLFPGVDGITTFKLISQLLLTFVIIWFCPNSQNIIDSMHFNKITPRKLVVIGVFVGVIFTICISSMFQSVSFIYFQF